MKKGFTLIEIVTVVAIISILAIVVVLTLNPFEVLRQTRDARRVSDMGTLNKAVSLYYEDAMNNPSTMFMGTSSVVYVSIPDPSATSTAGDQCQGLNLPTLPTGYTYQCAASSTYNHIDGTGWIPINLNTMTTGAPISAWPVDPTNRTSTRLYYTYTTNGTQFEVTAPMESAKYGLGGSGDVISPDGALLATVYAKGSNLFLEPLDYGDSTLVGYWPLSEGTSTIAYDDSGSNATGSWSGTQTGISGYYSTGNNQPWAGAFDGSTDYISSNGTIATTAWTVMLWIKPSANGSAALLNGATNSTIYIQGGTFAVYWGNASAAAVTASANQWNNVAFTYDGSNVAKSYLNGSYVASANVGVVATNFSTPFIGSINSSVFLFKGYIDDVRIYNRALSAAQIAAMYNGGK